MWLIGPLWGTLFARIAALSRAFSLELTAYLGFFIQRPFDWHQRCCFEIFNTFINLLRLSWFFFFTSFSSWKKFWKSNKMLKLWGLYLGNFPNLLGHQNMKKTASQPHPHHPSLSVHPQKCMMSDSWNTFTTWSSEGALIFQQLVSRGNICDDAASRTEGFMIVEPQVSVLMKTGCEELLPSLQRPAVSLSEALSPSSQD